MNSKTDQHLEKFVYYYSRNQRLKISLYTQLGVNVLCDLLRSFPCLSLSVIETFTSDDLLALENATYS